MSDATPTPVLQPKVVQTAITQREEWMVEIAKRLRAAVVDGRVDRVFDICRASFDAGETARERRGKDATCRP
jgi:hypothetical protein